jgi:hypothetical protein
MDRPVKHTDMRDGEWEKGRYFLERKNKQRALTVEAIM